MNRATEWIRRHAAAPSTDHLIRATVATTAMLLILAGATLYLTAQGRIGVARANRSDEIAACRSEQRGQVDQAVDRLEEARVQRDDALIAGLVAAVTGDDAALAELVDLASVVRAETTDALASKRDATRAYAEAVELSRTDPGRFLAECRGGAG